MEFEAHLKKMSPASRAKMTRLKQLMAEGVNENRARQEVGWDRYATWKYFKQRHDLLDHLAEWREANQITAGDKAPIRRSFADFCRDILGQPIYPHMEQWREWMENPEADHVLITTRPESGKSAFARNYCLYRLCEDPTIRITIASASLNHARDQVAYIRGVIESNTRLAAAYGNLKPTADQRHYPWSNEKLLVAARTFLPGEAESNATVQALGLEGQVEGIRADLFIIDDPDGQLKSVYERNKLFSRIVTVVEDRMTVGAKLVILTNRWDTLDIAGLIQRQEQEAPGLWKIHTTPAIKRWADPEDPDDWGEVLWPEKFGSESNRIGENWTPKRAWQNVFGRYKRLKAAGKERLFFLMYQNDPVGDGEKDFTQEVVAQATQRGEDVSFGTVPANATVVCALDPAGTEGAGVIALAVLPGGLWQVVDCDWGRGRRSEGMHEWMRDYARYRPTYWAIEGQGPWKEWADSREIKDICAAQAAVKIVLKTGENKWKKDIGVASLVPEVMNRLIIPSKNQADRDKMRPLEYQLLSYRPPQVVNGLRVSESSEPYDLLMALWLAARIIRDKGLGPKPDSADRNYWAPKDGYRWWDQVGGRGGKEPNPFVPV